MLMYNNLKKGFTLIELIITVAILAILVSILVVALNPAEQLARSRDAKRIADLDAIKTALNLYSATATGTISMDGNSTANSTCLGGTGVDTWFNNNNGAAAAAATSTGTGLIAVVTSTGQSVASGTAVVASTWMPAILGQTPGGAPLSNLPLDPNGGGSDTYYYSYACRSNKTYELKARMDSTYFKTDLNIPGTDGGNSSSTYEAGTDLTIINPGF